jgi:2-dehydro-3-deoxygalactonokinase
MAGPASLIGLDWGTTSLRAYRIANDGSVQERREGPLGILAITDGDFAGALARTIGDWLRAEPGLPVLASGMIGSRQGWHEAPYAPCPAGAADLSDRLVTVDGPDESVYLAPGLSTREPGTGVPDVMRGEETQILGALEALPDADLFVLPGTHSKWATVEGGRITDFRTWMTGEVFDVLRRHSILGRLMEGDGQDEEAFLDGVDRGAAEAAGVLHAIFAARTFGLMGDLPGTALAPYLSGVLIGAEIAGARAWSGGRKPVVIASGRLTDAYLQAMARLGMAGEAAAPDAVVRGLFGLARAAGLLERDHG